MKLLITSSGTALESPVDPRFGRAKQFLVVDSETLACEAHDNAQNLNAAQGAGIQAAQNAVNLGAEAVISGHCGPKAFSVLKAGGIRVYTTQAATVKEAVELFREGKLAEASDADVEGHW
ncbi:MAG: NifB/NifX family molybdenum-iron cluster-binding protein [Phycisphaerae bacterium]|nr:NifB/NifX family molybdenum-iron cluster-binding protein [Phycisphaerae bacterium]